MDDGPWTMEALLRPDVVIKMHNKLVILI